MRPILDLSVLLITALLVLVCSLPFISNASASTPAPESSTSPSVSRADEVQRDLGDLTRNLEDINAKYTELLERLKTVEQRRQELEVVMNQVEDLQAVRGGADTANRSDDARETVGDDQKRELESQQDKLPEIPRVSSDVGGVLTPRGKFILEPSVSFSNNSFARVSINGLSVPGVNIGDFEVRSVERETLTMALTGRYGITNRLEAELKASWVSRDDDTVTRRIEDQTSNDELFNATGDGIGDIEFGLRYQFRKRPNQPFLVGNLRVKSATGEDPFEIETQELLNNGPDFAGKLGTGSGFWSVNPSLTFIYPSDPVVIFGNVGYLWTLEDDKGIFPDPNATDPDATTGFGKVDPGDAWRFNFGMGIGLNEMSSISFSYALDLFSETTIETSSPRKITGSDSTVGKFIVGYSFKTPGGMPLSLAVGIGTTDSAPDTDLTFRIPFTIFE